MEGVGWWLGFRLLYGRAFAAEEDGRGLELAAQRDDVAGFEEVVCFFGAFAFALLVVCTGGVRRSKFGRGVFTLRPRVVY